MILCDDDLALLPQVGELCECLEEVESSGSRRMKAQLQAMDGKIVKEELYTADKYVVCFNIHLQCTIPHQFYSQLSVCDLSYTHVHLV